MITIIGRRESGRTHEFRANAYNVYKHVLLRNLVSNCQLSAAYGFRDWITKHKPTPTLLDELIELLQQDDDYASSRALLLPWLRYECTVRDNAGA